MNDPVTPSMEGSGGDHVVVPVVRWKGGASSSENDAVCVEEPLEIFVDGCPFYLTMRSPGDELNLAAGLCFSEGVVDSIDDLAGISYCKDISTNRINVYIKGGRGRSQSSGRKGTSFSSCGICGKELIEDIAQATDPVAKRTTVSFAMLARLRDQLTFRQRAFHETGGTHAAAIFSSAGKVLAHSEDVGRHNALDKSLGRVLFARRREDAAIALLSSRLSFEMVQKAARFGIEILAGFSAPTSLGVQLASKVNLTLVGFLRAEGGNVYSAADRIIP